MQSDDFVDQKTGGTDDPADRVTVGDLDAQGVEGLAVLLENQPDSAAEILNQWVQCSEDVPSLFGSFDFDEKEQAELQERVAQALALPSSPAATSLGELRANARLTVDDVAEKVGLPAETIGYMEEDNPVIDVSRPLLRVLGDLYGYSAAQIETVLRFQGNPGAAPASCKLRRGSAGQGGSPSNMPTPRSFAQVLADTGATVEQTRHWLIGDSEGDGEGDDIAGLTGDHFA